MQRIAVSASLAIHAVGLALLIGAQCGDAREPARGGTGPVISVEIVAPARPAERAAAAPAAAFAAPAAPAHRVRPPRAARARSAAGDRANQLAITGVDRGELGTGMSGNSNTADHGSSGVGNRGIVSTAHVAGLAPSAVAAVPLPPAPAPSKARPPRLIYPAREGRADDSDPFLARVTIDRDGYVVGAHLVRGWERPLGGQAASLIWRFRYAPALDDDGNAIRATIEQPFLVGR